MNLTDVIFPELILVIVACGLFLLGISAKATARRAAAILALVALVGCVLVQGRYVGAAEVFARQDFTGAIEVGRFADYVKFIAAIVGVLLVLLAWPTNPQATGSRSLEFGRDAGEFFGLMLLSLAGLMLVASANDLMLLFLGLELASIPTYIMVSMSRPLPAAQEAGVKYFFLGAMAAAIMLFGFSYLYGTTGLTKLSDIREFFNPASGAPHTFTQWQVLAICLLLAGFGFKIAAVPLHTYVGDVYQGAATPVTAFLAFVPKTSGFVAIVKVLLAVGGPSWRVPAEVVNLLWVLAALTMTVGNMLGLLQHNVKRVLAYSSIAHSGYMLVGITALVAAGDPSLGLADRADVQRNALAGVLFYLAAYGLMNTGAFGVLMLLPPREHGYHPAPGMPLTLPEHLPATSAETYEDIAGIGRRHIGMALAMAVCCFSLIGMPLTVGFFGKLYLAQPAVQIGTTKMNWLVTIMMINAAIGAAYYLRIVATMFLREQHAAAGAAAATEAELRAERPWYATPIGTAIILAVGLTMLLGSVFPATNRLSDSTHSAADVRSLASPPPTTPAATEPRRAAASPLVPGDAPTASHAERQPLSAAAGR